MPRFIDETGNKYGHWNVIKKVDNPQKNGALFLCRCDCGHEQLILGKRLREGKTTQCINCQAKARMNNLAGKKFNMLTVLNEYEHRGRRIYWHCKCDCGGDTWVEVSNLRENGIKSCGCLSHQYHGQLEDLTGQQFNDLTVLSYAYTKDHIRYWHCKCICGAEKNYSTTDLKQERVKSCGCRRKLNLTPGTRIGKLTILSETNKKINNGAFLYKCQCDCGNICEVPGSNLKKGDWLSCGCMKNKSYGEDQIELLLKEHNLTYIKQKTFEGCKSDWGRLYRFDFFVNNQYIIEYDGSQHFTYTGTGWDTEEHYNKTHQADLLKNQYCFEHNIPIIRIPYDKSYQIDDLILETTHFLLTPQNEKEYYDN